MPITTTYTGNQKQLPRNNNSQYGFTMIEVLVAVLILSIGLLGMAGLQTAGIKESRESYFRTQAAILAADMADRMRANPVAANSGAYVLALSENGQDATCSPCASANEIADKEKADWVAAADPDDSVLSIADLLPQGVGVITRSGSVYNILIAWGDTAGASLPTACTEEDRNVECFRLDVQP